MKVTVLGKSPSWQDADGACSGYLVEDRGTRLLLDCGSGVFAKLRLFCDYVDVDAVVLSHLHADHFLDLIPYSYALIYAPRQQPVAPEEWPSRSDGAPAVPGASADPPARPRLIGPPGATEVFRRVAGSWGNEDLVERAFAIEQYGEGSDVEVGSLTLRFRAVPHFIPTHAISISDAAGRRVTYGADSRPSDELVELAQGSELLLVEATLPRPEQQGDRGHMTPREAGEHGRRAGAGQVVLTHISDELDAGWAREEAAAGFGGPVEVAAEGAVYEV